MSSSVSVPWWAAILVTLIGPAIGFAGSVVAARLQRRTGSDTVRAMRESIQVTKSSALASTRSAEAAERAARTAEQAERHVNNFRMHDDTMRTLYWAADHAIAPESHRALLGLEVLARLAEQARADANNRAGRIVSATDTAVRKVAVPTFLARTPIASSWRPGSTTAASGPLRPAWGRTTPARNTHPQTIVASPGIWKATWYSEPGRRRSRLWWIGNPVSRMWWRCRTGTGPRR